ncbi:phosphoribosyltransferase [Nocardia sp. CDC159]|uniref:Phosphoribosyltransferase n=1 Tax=Nocardia pulmonis TaxID=2951408 RepID=A0A9X2EAG3_9NOCA|nr:MULTISPECIES: phosphoribosyltransferase family protein [Nocardia]MCM6775773.1 phosphoribosyltransferase [Nocardia pulmonis]MCM6788251.1 phosphoribosyltransferase [Nocardia sp. CDC159]
MLFLDRRDAGRRLTGRLMAFRGPDVVVVGLAGGGVAVAAEIAARLRVLLDVMVVHELRPAQSRPAFGAIAEHGVRVVDPDRLRALPTGTAELTRIERRERDTLRRRSERFRGGRPHCGLAGHTVVLVDECLADAARARAACRAAYAYGAIRVVYATPVACTPTVTALAGDADKIVCLHTCDHLDDIAEHYQDFTPIDDDHIHDLLRHPDSPTTSAPRRAG